MTDLRAISGGGQHLGPERFVDRKEMARILGVSLATLDKWVQQDRIPSVTWGVRVRRFQASVVIARLRQLDVERAREEGEAA